MKRVHNKNNVNLIFQKEKIYYEKEATIISDKIRFFMNKHQNDLTTQEMNLTLVASCTTGERSGKINRNRNLNLLEIGDQLGLSLIKGYLTDLLNPERLRDMSLIG